MVPILWECTQDNVRGIPINAHQPLNRFEYKVPSQPNDYQSIKNQDTGNLFQKLKYSHETKGYPYT